MVPANRPADLPFQRASHSSSDDGTYQPCASPRRKHYLYPEGRGPSVDAAALASATPVHAVLGRIIGAHGLHCRRSLHLGYQWRLMRRSATI